MARPLYEKFVEWVIEQHAFEIELGAKVVAAKDLREAAQEWISRSLAPGPPEEAANMQLCRAERRVQKEVAAHAEESV